MKQAVPVFLFLCMVNFLQAQNCTQTGHTPSSAILLCGSNSYYQASVPTCGQTTVPAPCGGSFTNMNPTWFQMNCFNSGSLGFVIVPDEPGENVDWQLFDVTGRNNEDVFTDGSLNIACNWSPVEGETGASAAGSAVRVCSDPGADVYSKMPDIIKGHDYLLLVSMRTDFPHGFQIALSGGSASVTDPVEPDLFNARLSCDGRQVFVLLNKKMKCNTISPDGSDFAINAAANILSATPSGCNEDNEANFITLNLSTSIPAASYTLSMKNGADGNSIIDRCGRYIAIGNQVPLLPPGTESPLPDTLKLPVCSPRIMTLKFIRPVRCNSIAPDGSDFAITGPQTVNVSGVSYTCNMSNPQLQVTGEVQIQLAEPITTGGNYAINIISGSDGNSIADECGTIIPAGARIPFVAQPSVSADFSYSVNTSCKVDTVRFRHTSITGVNNWFWDIDGEPFSGEDSPVKTFSANGEYHIRLIVTNGTCSDTARATIRLDNKVTAAFEIPAAICPEDTLHVVNNSSPNADRWSWNFGAGIISPLSNPPPVRYPITGHEEYYNIKLVATNSLANCTDSMYKALRVLSGCYIDVPTAFTPNEDGLNDFLQPLNALKADRLDFKVYNRVGQLMFESHDWTAKWNGKIGSVPQPTGVYVWMLSYTNRDTGQRVFKKGTSVLIR